MRKEPSTRNEKKRSKGKKSRPRKQSNSDLNQVDGSSGHRKRKRRRMRSNSENQSSDSIDLTINLPDHVIHHILSRLRCKKDAARTSVLSKRWRDIWASYSILDFDERKFHKEDRKIQMPQGRGLIKLKEKKLIENKTKSGLFRIHVNNTLQRRIQHNCSIQKFSLHLTYYDRELAGDVNRWISLACESKIQELDLFIPNKRNLYFELPEIVYTADSITSLRLYGCKLGAFDDIRFSKLRKVCFGKLHIDENIVQNLMISCPFIDDFRLIRCISLKNLVLNSDRLDRVDIHFCHGMEKIEIHSLNLQTFWHHKEGSQNCKVNLASCRSLKNLTLEDPKMTNDTFQNHLSNFPVLEHLILSNCNALKVISITSHRLKTLALRACSKLREIDIDTPSLLSFDYSGQTHGIPFSSFNPSSLKEAKLYFGCSKGLSDVIGRKWYSELFSFISRFDHSKGFKFVVCSGKNVIIHEDMKQILFPRERNLKLEIIKSSSSLEEILDNLLRRWHPVTLSIVSSTSSDFSKKVQMKIENRAEEPTCCKYNLNNNKCWRHFLIDAKIEKLDDTEVESDWIDWLKVYAPLVNLKAFFRLEWKSL